MNFSESSAQMELLMEDIVIVGAGIAGLSTSLGLHRLGFSSLVLESSDCLRATGFNLGILSNGWKALDALGVGDKLREHFPQRIRGFQVASAETGLPIAVQMTQKNQKGNKEVRSVRRKVVLETLEKELPQGTIRYSSKVVSIEESGPFKLVHLEDGCVIQTKVLVGCDGVNSVVAKWLGLPNPFDTGRSAVRGIVELAAAHNFTPQMHAFFGGGIRFACIPCDDKTVYWYFTYNESATKWHADMAANPVKLKEFVLSRLTNVPKEASDIVGKTKFDSYSYSKLRVRLPWDIYTKNVVEKNVCLAGDALHPMTPDIAQGGCSALEDGVTLARCLGESFKKIQERETMPGRIKEYVGEEMVEIYKGLEKYMEQRRWRSFSLVTTALVVGFILESDNKLMRFLRQKFLTKYTVVAMMRLTDFDCGKLD